LLAPAASTMLPGAPHCSAAWTIAAEFGTTCAPVADWLNGELLAYGRQLAVGQLPAPKPSQPALPPVGAGAGAGAGSGVGVGAGAGAGGGVVAGAGAGVGAGAGAGAGVVAGAGAGVVVGVETRTRVGADFEVTLTRLACRASCAGMQRRGGRVWCARAIRE